MISTLAERAQADGLTTLSLVAVNGSAGFWRKHGFGVVTDAAITAKLLSYGASASFMVRRLS